MPETIGSHNPNGFAAFVSRIVDVCQRFAIFVVLIAILSTTVAAVYLVENIRIDTDTEEMLSEKLSFRQNTIALDKGFPDLDGLMLVVVDAPDPDKADDASKRLVDALNEKHDTFTNVFSLEQDPFLRRHGLLYKTTTSLESLSDRLTAAQPFLGTLWRQPNFSGLAHMLELFTKAEVSDTASIKEAANVLNEMADVTTEVKNGSQASLVWSQLLSGENEKARTSRRLITVKPKLNYASLAPAEMAEDTIYEIAKAQGLDGHGYSIRLTGSAALESDELKSVEIGMGKAGLISFCLVIVLLLAGLRSIGAMISLLVTLVIGLVWTAAFAIFALGALNLISVAFAVLFVGLSVDFGIHFVLRTSEHMGNQARWSDALVKGGRSVSTSLGICTVTTAIAFFSFIPTDYNGLAELGFIAGAGMFIALIANLTVLPALMRLLVKRPPTFVASHHGMSSWVGGFIQKKAAVIVTLGIISALAAGVVARDAKFDFDPMNLKDHNAPSVRTLFDLWEDGTIHPYSAEILTSSVQEGRELSARLKALSEVDDVESIDNLIPQNQDAKLEIIDRLALIMGPAFFAPQGEVTLLPADREKSLSLVKTHLGELQKNETWAKPATHLLNALEGLDNEMAAKVNSALFSGLPERLNTLVSALDAQIVSLDTLPDNLKSRYVTDDGKARLDVLPEKDVRNPSALRDFVRAVQAMAPNAAGPPIVIVEAGRAVLGAFAQALAISVIGISIVLWLVLRNAKDVFLVFIPVLIAALWTLAISALFNVPFNFANVIVLPLLFGLSVDFGIHIVLRRRDSVGHGLNSTTPRAVLISALTTIGSFGSIMLSGHPGTASMGLLLTISVSLSLAAILILLPAMMSLAYGNSDAEEKGGA